MGQKVNPVGLRLGNFKTWESQWYEDKKKYAEYIYEDFQIREFIKKKLNHAGVSKIEIERSSKWVRLRIFTARPGIVIGRKGSEIENLKKQLEKIVSGEVLLDIHEIKRPELDAQLISENVALQLTRRVAFRRAMQRGVSLAMKFGAEGVKIICSGRLGGAEMARTEWYKEGRIPLHTLRANIDYGISVANTTYGVIGIKVFVFKGEILSAEDKNNTLPMGKNQKMLSPKKVKFRKQQRGRMKGMLSRGTCLNFGEFGLQAVECGKIGAREIEAARIAMTRHAKRGGKMWIRIFPDKPFTKKPAEVRMGKGKGAPEGWEAVIRPGKMLYEMAGISKTVAKEALRLASHKLSVKTRFVSRDEQ